LGSNLKKIRSLNLNTKILLGGIILSLGFLGTFLLNNFLRDNYNSRKSELEDSIIHNNNILVLNKENKILGIACLDESFEIKPKVVFNAIG